MTYGKVTVRSPVVGDHCARSLRFADWGLIVVPYTRLKTKGAPGL